MTTNHRQYKVITHREDPERVSLAQQRIGGEWPEFMLHDPVAQNLTRCYTELPDFQFILVDPETDETVSIGNSIPLAWDGEVEDLPDDGWDWALLRGLEDLDHGRRPTILCALQIVVFGDQRGRGISGLSVRAMKQNGRAHGLNGMVAPVRPSRKCDYPITPISEYIKWKTDNSPLPFDPWMRVHARAGARIVKPCPTAMRITGTVAEWEQWAGMPFPESGEYTVPGALVPVVIDREKDLGTYIEPNVWMHHPPQ